jgi:hypothetical protein
VGSAAASIIFGPLVRARPRYEAWSSSWWPESGDSSRVIVGGEPASNGSFLWLHVASARAMSAMNLA